MYRAVRRTESKTKKLVKMALFIAISGIGAYIKIQGSIALDSMGAFLAALLIDPLAGGIVALVGHLLSALTSGFPLTLPMHLLVSVLMSLVVWGFGILYRKNHPLMAAFAGILFNGPGSTLLAAWAASLMGLPLGGKALFLMMWLPLTLASAVNIFLTLVVYKALGGTRGGIQWK
ncbi:ECF transporter S component [Alkaliphilus crotonatoxidans]